jgi:3D (Asp-Asp-Asp) domain-containing protein
MKNVMRYLLLSIVILFFSAPFLTLPGATTELKPFIVYDKSFILDTLTIYNPVRSQCDSDPMVTASNQKINKAKLRDGSIRWIALSRDLLRRWGGSLHYGDTVSVRTGDATVDGIWIVQDTMHKRFRNRGDLLFDMAIRSSGRWTNVTVSKRMQLAINN